MGIRSTKRLAVLAVVVIVMASLGCASLKTEGHPWTTHYVGDPDLVWQALHLAMIELDYEVESESRFDGTISAVRTADDQTGTVVLSIDQIMRTNDVNVYVRVAAGPGEPAMSLDLQEKHAKDFLALVNGLLYK